MFKNILTITLLLAGGAHSASIDTIRIFDANHASLAGNRSIYWLDDTHLLFAGIDQPAPRQSKDAHPTIFIWEIGKEIRSVTNLFVASVLCVRKPRFAYAVHPPGAKIVVYLEQLTGEATIVSGRIDRMNCEVVSSESSSSSGRRTTFSLLPGDGFLDLGPASGEGSIADSVVIHHSSGGTETPLPFHRWEFVSPEYYQFKDAYFVRVRGSGKAQETEAAYWLMRDGTTENVTIPAGITGVQPFRDGLLYRIFGSKKNPPDGIYFLPFGQQGRPLLLGYVTEFAVSPNGCRVAFSYASSEKSYFASHGTSNTRTVKVANLCGG